MHIQSESSPSATMNSKLFCAQIFVENLLNEGDLISCDDKNPEFKEIDVPHFFDQRKFKRAQLFFKKHYAAITFGKLIGLLFGLSDPKLNRILQFTKKSSHPAAAYKRYKTTIEHILLWYESELYYLSDSWKSLQIIRNRHNYNSKLAFGNFQYRITQKDMALAQLSFITCVLLIPQKIGIYNASHSEILAFIHFWRNIGCILGIEDRFNICRDSVEETQEICKELIKYYYAPKFKMKYLEQHLLKMGKALINGLRSFVPFLDFDGCITITKNIVFDIEVNKNSQNEKYFKSYIFIIYFMRYTVVRIFMNWFYRIMFWMGQHYPNFFYKLE